jgi:hypothetical protein
MTHPWQSPDRQEPHDAPETPPRPYEEQVEPELPPVMAPTPAIGIISLLMGLVGAAATFVPTLRGPSIVSVRPRALRPSSHRSEPSPSLVSSLLGLQSGEVVFEVIGNGGIDQAHVTYDVGEDYETTAKWMDLRSGRR